MFEKAPFVYISKSLDELKKIRDAGLGSADIDTDTLLFDTTRNKNLLSIDHSLINDESNIVVKVIDPTGEISSSFLDVEVTNTKITNPTRVYLLYGIGSDGQNKSSIIETSLIRVELDISKGRVYTLIFSAEQLSERNIVNIGRYSTLPETKVVNYFGISQPISKLEVGQFGETFISENPTVLLEDFSGNEFTYKYEYSEAITDAIHSLLRDKYKTPNTLVLLPSLDSFLDELDAVYLLADEDGRYKVDNHLNTIGFALLSKNTILENLNTNTYDYSSPVGGILSENSVEDEYTNYITTYDSLEGIEKKINNITEAAIDFKLFEEQNAAVKEILIERLGGSPLLGGTSNKTLDPDLPLVVWGDSDLINYYIYKNDTFRKAKIPSKFLVTTYLDKLRKDSELTKAVKRTVTLNDSLLPFFGRNSQNTLGSEVSIEFETPVFSFGDKQPNIMSINVSKNSYAYLEFINHVSDTYDIDALKKIVNTEEFKKIVPSILEFIKQYGNPDINQDSVKKNLKNLTSIVTTEEIPDTIVSNLMDFIVSSADRDSEDNIVTEKVSGEDILVKINNTLEAVEKLDRYSFQIDVKTLPLFLYSNYDSINEKCELNIREPFFLQGTEDNKIGSDFYNGQYFIIGFRHHMSSSKIFSEFKLISFIPSLIRNLGITFEEEEQKAKTDVPVVKHTEGKWWNLR